MPQIIAVVVSLVVILFAVVPAAAQPATPSPDAPPPDLCQTAPRSLDDLNAASATPAAPPPQRTPGVVPDGTPADPETVAAITTTIREFVACLNAGELLRAYGLYTDDYLRRLFWRQPPLSQTDYDSYAIPMPAPANERATILAIRDARLLPDGSAGATVTIKYAVIPIPKTFFFTLVQNDDRWLIADILGEISFSVP